MANNYQKQQTEWYTLTTKSTAEQSSNTCNSDIPSVSRMFLYKLMESVSFINSLTTSPWSFSTTNTSSGFAIREIIMRRTWLNKNSIIFKLITILINELHSNEKQKDTKW